MTEVANEDCVCEGVDVKLVFENGTLGALTGEVKAYAGAVVPAGYLKCDGAAVSREDYADLFEAISTIYGEGDSATTFNIPDLRGEFIRGFDGGRGVDANRVLGSNQEDEFKNHKHPIGNANGGHGLTNGGCISATWLSETTTGAGRGNMAEVGGVETRPRNVAMMYIIKT